MATPSLPYRKARWLPLADPLPGQGARVRTPAATVPDTEFAALGRVTARFLGAKRDPLASDGRAGDFFMNVQAGTVWGPKVATPPEWTKISPPAVVLAPTAEGQVAQVDATLTWTMAQVDGGTF